MSVRVLKLNDEWFGVTYKKDKDAYPKKLLNVKD